MGSVTADMAIKIARGYYQDKYGVYMRTTAKRITTDLGTYSFNRGAVAKQNEHGWVFAGDCSGCHPAVWLFEYEHGHSAYDVAKLQLRELEIRDGIL